MTPRVATTAAGGPTCTVEVPGAGWSYVTGTSPGSFDLRHDGADAGWVQLDETVEHHSVRMAEIVAGLNHQPPPNGRWEGPAATFVADIRDGTWPTDRTKYPEAWRARNEMATKPTHVIAGAGGTHTLCGVRRVAKAAVPVVLARFAAVHVESYGCELCPPCARALAELEEASDG